jgi:hypothetical protein
MSLQPFGEDDSEYPVADPAPWAVQPKQKERMRICMRAAQMRARGAEYSKIARKLGLKSGADAKKCVEQAWSFSPGDDVYTARRTAAARQNMIIAEAFEVIENPGPMVNVAGIVRDADGNPVPDKANKVAALRVLLEADKAHRQLHGADAPKRAVSAHVVIGPENVDAHIETVLAEIAEERRRNRIEQERLSVEGTVLPDDGDEDDGGTT